MLSITSSTATLEDVREASIQGKDLLTTPGLAARVARISPKRGKRYIPSHRRRNHRQGR